MKRDHMMRQMLMVSESSFCPDTAVCAHVHWCVRACGWGVGTCLRLTHAALSPLDRGRKAKLGRSERAAHQRRVFRDKNTAGEQPGAQR